MKQKYYDDQEKNYKNKKRKIRHTRNRPGKGMRIINYYDNDDDFNYFEEDFSGLAVVSTEKSKN